MKTQLVEVTPKMAREWLKANHSNRPLRPNVVDGFHTAYNRGEWKLTHQGIAFSKNGRLLDGQHRLTFISELPDGVLVPLNVTEGQDEDTFDSIDIGVGRTMADVYGLSNEVVSVARFIAKIDNSSSNQGLTNQHVKPFADWLEPEFTELLSFCPTKKKMWSSAPVRAAAILQMKRGYDADFIKIAYHSLVMADVSSMPFAAQALMKQYISGKIASARSLDLFCRALRVFDSTNNKRVATIIVQDISPVLSKVRDFIEQDMKKIPVYTGLKVAKPFAKFNWKK